MKRKQNYSPPFNDGNDELRAENALIKLKLEMDHGMLACETGRMSPVEENQFLRYLLEFHMAMKRSLDG